MAMSGTITLTKEEEKLAPMRSYLDDPNIVWRDGLPELGCDGKKPNFSKVNKLWLAHRTKAHPEGSLEKVVENLVKTWEAEATHKENAKDWGCIDYENYKVRANNGRWFGADETARIGNYQWLMEGNVKKEDYNWETHDFGSSLGTFHKVFSEGFAWEVLEVFTGPPEVNFSWRHFAPVSGEYKDKKPTGKILELFGFARVKVTDELKIQTIEIFYKPQQFLDELNQVGINSEAAKGVCPVARS